MDSKNICTACQCSKCKQSGSQEKPLAEPQDETVIENDIGSDVDTRNQIKPEPRCQASSGIFAEYCENSRIHGIRYLGEQKRPLPERIFWICVFFLSLYICVSLLMNVWKKWNSNTVNFVFDDKLTSVYEIPFPTVTICLSTKFRGDVFQFNQAVQNMRLNTLTEKERYYMDAVVQICNIDFGNENLENNFANGTDLMKVLDNIAPTFTSLFDECSWLANSSCESFFHPVLTDEGICYNFNDLDPRDIYRDEVLIYDELLYDAHKNKYKKAFDWDLENGYNLDVNGNAFPFRLVESGIKAGVNMKFIYPFNENGYMCRQREEGFKIVLTTPGEVSQVSQRFIPIPIGQEVLISMEPEIIRTSEGLRHLDPMRRHCYFQNERYLRYFKVYTQSNCKLECLTNFTLKHCGCVKFSMPKSIETPVCGGKKTTCMSQAASFHSGEELRRSLRIAEEDFDDENFCNCLPSCTSINYKVEVSQSRLSQSDKTNFQLQFSIFYKEAQFLATKRSELYNITDFLADCGGLLGLLMGISTLTIVEFVYFCTVRVIGSLRMRRKKKLQRLQDEERIATGKDIDY